MDKKTFSITKTLPDGKQVEIPTLLSDFLELKARNYVEPKRAGTPKGERVGFSKRKYVASLCLALTNLKLKEQAEKLDVTYGLLRKWASEADFRAEIAKHRQDFVGFIMQYLAARHKAAWTVWNDMGEPPAGVSGRPYYVQ